MGNTIAFLILFLAVLWTLQIFFSKLRDDPNFKPSIVGWMGMTLSTFLMMLSFLIDSWGDVEKLWSGALYFISFVNSLIIVLSLLLKEVKGKDKNYGFTKLEFASIPVSLIVITLWIPAELGYGEYFTDLWSLTPAELANYLLQLLLVVSYSALGLKIFALKKQIDSPKFWSVISLSGLAAVYMAFTPDGESASTMAKVNSIRSVTFPGIVCLLLLYYGRVKDPR